ncbi:MAG: TIGR03067 domain-containing protein [Gemmataceae bacterium]|nr:TIGR03067 domain-containing protein [Gemmataceae bacterium]
MRSLLLTGLFLVGTTALAEPQGDATALQGTWAIHAARLGGRDHADDFAGMKLVIAGDKYTVDFGKNTDKGTFTLDGKATPRRIDITSAEGPFKGKTLPGIYELKGDTLVLCLDSDGKAAQRPAKFDAPEKTPTMLLTFRREK